MPMVRGSAMGIGLRPQGAPPPAPPRSFLTERGEFDRASVELAAFRRPCRRARGSTTCITLTPERPPLRRPLSPAAREKGENSIPRD
jgi:hypothetical protein